MQAHVGNYPGVTVEKKIGRIRVGETAMRLVDLPGTYSLAPRSPDEMVSVDVLLGRQPEVGRIDVVLCIVDAANLERNLFLVSQVLDLGLPTVVVLNMYDVARQRGTEIDVPELAKRLGLPVVPTEAHRRIGIEKVRQAIVTAAESPHSQSPCPLSAAVLRRMCRTLVRFTGAERECDPRVSRRTPASGRQRPYRAVAFGKGGRQARRAHDRSTGAIGESGLSRSDRRGKSSLRSHSRAPVRRPATFVGTAGNVQRPHRSFLDPSRLGACCFPGRDVFALPVDLHRGPPVDGGIETGQKFVRSAVEAALPPGALQSLICDGVIGGVGSVILFLPQIVFLFLFIGVLEDCGYMARAAFLMDRLMARLGLSGKSFIPLMSSFACAIPGVMATRVIENRRDRMVTMLVAPLMSCSARLPVYLLLIGAFIPATTWLGGWVSLQGLALLAMSSVGALVAIPAAWLMKQTIFRSETPPFVMELPTYKIPSPRVVFYRAYDRGRAFVTRAGTLIFATAIVVWFAGYFPGDHRQLNDVQAQIQARQHAPSGDPAQQADLSKLIERQNELSSGLIEASFLGRLGHAIEPAVRPLGWDWRIGVGAIASFPAREVIIATLGTIYSLGSDVEAGDQGLIDSLRNATRRTAPRSIIFRWRCRSWCSSRCAAQCAGTLMTIKRETNRWIWPVFTFVYMTTLAYVGAFLTYQIGIHLG